MDSWTVEESSIEASPHRRSYFVQSGSQRIRAGLLIGCFSLFPLGFYGMLAHYLNESEIEERCRNQLIEL